MRPKVYRTSINGRDYQYCDLGKGKSSTILLHGISGDKGTLRDLAEAFGPSSRCIILDLPGRQSIDLQGIDSIEDLARYLHGLIQELKLQEFSICGFSLGGLIALKYAELFAAKNCLKKIVVWASPMVEHNHRISLVIRVIRSTPEFLYRLLQRPLLIKTLAGLIGIPVSTEVARTASALSKKDALSILEMIDKGSYNLDTAPPKLFIYDPEDRVVSLDSYYYVRAAKKKNSRIEIIAGSGHGTDQAGRQASIKSIRRFLRAI